MNDIKWDFPDNNYSIAAGVNPTNTEIFRKEPVAYFAREICQNSIDAPIKGSSQPVRVVFNTFKIHRDSIPGVDTLIDEVSKCKDYIETQGKDEYSQQVGRLYDSFGSDNNPYIPCLRVSDFNTTGLVGAKTNQPGLPFFELTRREGSSPKNGNSAGSKGIGKFASFVVSNTRTVFYSTRAYNANTDETETAYIGLSRLFARPLNNDGLFTLGTGYFAKGNTHFPIQTELYLDPDFKREENEFGTDVYVIGFTEDAEWKNDITRKVLDSFMAAIIFGSLEVIIDDIVINKDTLRDIINNLRKQPITRENRVIISQYELLSSDGETIHKKTVCIDGSDIDIFVKTYDLENEKWASKQCVKIRYPYMKITHSLPSAMAPFSAMCLIGDNQLNAKLKELENPQHTEWQKNILKDRPEQFKEMSKILYDIDSEINDFVAEVLKTESGDSTDFEGAGDYLPDTDMAEDGLDTSGDDDKPVDDEPIVGSPSRRKNRKYDKNTKEPGDESKTADMGTVDENGVSGSEDPRKRGTEPYPSPGPDPLDTPPEKKYIDGGDTPFMKHLVSDSIRFRCMKPTSSVNMYEIMFVANDDNDDCEMNIYAIGDSNDREKIMIESASINERPCEITDGSITNFSMTKGEAYKVSCIINRDGLFASKVEIYANK
ncbi:hypothetical protein IJI86_00945 [Candidatus Saccharibacteria bacterium]|nr:hypothetical protein [Candidatus Saccharibacteria bacterium]